MRSTFRKLIIEVSLALTAIIVIAIFSIPKFLAAQNVNRPECIPDPILRASVEIACRCEKSGIITRRDAAKLTGIVWFTPGRIQDFTGIEYFKSIKSFRYYENTTLKNRILDLSHNTQLEEIRIEDAQIGRIVLPKTESLTEIFISGANITGLDVSMIPNLEKLTCPYNQLTSLDLSNNPKLTFLNCSKNPISQITFPEQNNIKELFICHTNFREIDLSNFKSLEWFMCHDSQFKELDLSQNINLREIQCDNNQLEILDLSNNPKVTKIHCGNNQIHTLTLGKKYDLQAVRCNNNQLTSAGEFLSYPTLVHLQIENNLLDKNGWPAVRKLIGMFEPIERMVKSSPRQYGGLGFTFSPQKNIDPYGYE